MPEPIIPAVSLAIPCYNEEGCIEGTVRDLLRVFQAHRIPLEVVLVDNGSTDGTGAILDRLVAEGLPVHKVRVPVNQGYGLGALEGLRACRAPRIGILCADGEVGPEDVARLCEMLIQDQRPSLAKVRRRYRKDGILRKIQSTIYNVLMSVIFGALHSLDVNGSPKIFPRSAFERMHLRSHDWFLDAEIMIKARWLRLHVIETDVQGKHRQGGKSHVKWHTCVEFVRNIFRYRLSGAAAERAKVLGQSSLGANR